MSAPRHVAVADDRGSLVATAWTWIAGVAMLVATVCVFVPFAPLMPTGGVDGSWMLAINEAVAEHMAIGRAVVFTAGPYSSIYTTVFHPGTDDLMLAGSAYLAVAYAACLVAIARRGRWAFPPAFLLVLCCIRFPRDTLLFTFPLLVVVVVLDLARRTIDRRGERTASGVLVALAFAGLGLLPLIKGTLLIVCVALVPLCVALLVVEKRTRLATIALGAFVAGTVGFWAAAGQSLADLPRYFASTLPIASGYAEAMSLPGEDPGEIWAYVGATILLTSAASRVATLSRMQRGYLGLAVFLLLFVTFKSGYVRHDGHVVIASSFLLFAAVVLLAVDRARWMIVAFIASIAAWQYVDEHFYATRARDLTARAEHLFGDAWRGIERRRLDADGIAGDYRATLADVATRHPIPALGGTSDIYPYDITDLIASGNRWSPRPVFQSYSAYTPALAAANRDFLAGATAPDHVIFAVQPFDGRVPALDDGTSWPVLLGRYRPVATRDGRLYLDRQADAVAAPLSTSRPAESHRLGDVVRVPPTTDPLFAELDVHPSLAGRLFALLFKPGQLWITLQLEDGSSRAFRLVSGAARTGFVLSPLVEDTSEFAMLYGAEAALDGKRVASFTIDRRTGSPFLWQRTFEVRFRDVTGIARADLGPVLGVDRFDDAANFAGSPEPAACDGSIDHANGAPLLPALAATGYLRLDGWLAASAADGRLPERTYIVLTDDAGRARFVDTHPTPRPDVATHFGRPSLDRSGYATLVDLAGLSGRYRVSLAYRSDGVVRRCSQFDVPLAVRAR